MKITRKYVTPFLSLVFLVVGFSGLLMFFHLADGYLEVVHEVLGLFFVLCAIFHIVLNWKALKIHFGKGVFLPALFAVAVISVLLILEERRNPPIDLAMMDKLVRAPVNDTFRALQVDSARVVKRLGENGLSLDGAETLEDIWVKNRADPEEVINIVLGR